MPAVTRNSSSMETKQKFNAWHWRLGKSCKVHISTNATRGTCKACSFAGPSGCITAQDNWTRRGRHTKQHTGSLALERAALLLRLYLKASHCTARTDHDALRFILNIAGGRRKLVQWYIRLSKVYVGVVHHPGDEHHKAEVLFPLVTSAADKSRPEEDVSVITTTSRARNWK